jgi:Phytanoyl-CoA dioxygenase (PhyH)
MLDESLEALASIAGTHPLVSLNVTAAERTAGRLSGDRLKECCEQFERTGYIRLTDLFDAAQMQMWSEYYFRRYGWYTQRTRAPDRRPIVPVSIEGVFNNTTLLRNPILDQILTHFLGRYILGALGSVVSHPGAPNQVLHRDSAPLFSVDNEADKDMPYFSFNMLLPLVDCTAETGRTRLWPGSHRMGTMAEGLSVGSLDPDVSVGSVLLTDGRLLHRGAANRSDRVRPLLYYSYQKCWYQDQFGYSTRPRVMLSHREFAKMLAPLQDILAWTQTDFRKIKFKHAMMKLLPAPVMKMLAAHI